MQRINPNEPPEDGLPPQEVRITELHLEPWPEDARRVRVSLELTPFLERPNLEVFIQNVTGQEVSSINIIESIDSRMTFTMHLRGEDITGHHTLVARVHYPDMEMVDEKRLDFETNLPSA